MRRGWSSPEESNFMCRLIRPILNTVEDELDIFQFSKINLVPIVGLEPTYSRFLNSFKVPSELLNGISD